MGLPSVRNHVKALLKQGFLRENKEGLYTGYLLGDSVLVRSYKRNDLLARLEECGLMDALETKFRPTCIVLYGSAVEGRDDERGDIDIFLQAARGDFDPGPYEKKLKRSISLLYEPDLTTLNEELLNSLANGIVLRGFLKVI